MGEVAAGPGLIGMAIAFITLETHLASLHARLGVAIIALSVVQGWLGTTIRHWKTERAAVTVVHRNGEARKVRRGSKHHRRSLADTEHSMFEQFWCVYKNCCANVSLRRELQLRCYHRAQGYAICVAATCQMYLGLRAIGAAPAFFYVYYASLCLAALLVIKLQRARSRGGAKSDSSNDAANDAVVAAAAGSALAIDDGDEHEHAINNAEAEVPAKIKTKTKTVI